MATIFFLLSVSATTAAPQDNSTILRFLPAFIHASDKPAAANPVVDASMFSEPPKGDGRYVVIAWNDLGMHCMDDSFQDFAILPPYNTLYAQVIRRGEEPKIVTSGVQVQYRILNNTTSVHKTDFWNYAQELFSLPGPLPEDTGLAGKGLTGSMDPRSGYFLAEGIPLTEYFDDTTRSPYQLAEVVVRDSQGVILAGTQTVLPVSTEMRCDNCHADNGSANASIATGTVKQNILILHDQKHKTSLMINRPVLCANCHGSNALGITGNPELPSLSLAMHRRHASLDDGTMEGTCYQCHPGRQTKCFRGVMFKEGLSCHDCHGGMSKIADPDRRPWIDEPRCGSCHADHQENAGKLYRLSLGHKGIMCSVCHGSTHAIYPSTEPLDNRQSIWLQGSPGTINNCRVCHTNDPDENEGPHQEHGDDD